jgi:hypothetical protein
MEQPMKVSVTRQNILHNPLAPPRPLVVDTEALAPGDAAEVTRLAAAARAEVVAPSGAGRDYGVEILIEDGGQQARITRQEGQLTPATADLVDAVARLANR